MEWLLDSQKYHGLKRTVDFMGNHVGAPHHPTMVLHTDPCYLYIYDRMSIDGFGEYQQERKVVG